jgi:hypothetical protein
LARAASAPLLRQAARDLIPAKIAYLSRTAMIGNTAAVDPFSWREMAEQAETEDDLDRPKLNGRWSGANIS